MKNHMARREDTARDGIEAAIAAMVSRVAEEHARNGAVVELVARRGCKVGKTQAPEHTEQREIRLNAEQEGVRGSGGGRAAGPAIEEVGGGVEGLYPKYRREVCV